MKTPQRASTTFQKETGVFRTRGEKKNRRNQRRKKKEREKRKKGLKWHGTQGLEKKKRGSRRTILWRDENAKRGPLVNEVPEDK